MSALMLGCGGDSPAGPTGGMGGMGGDGGAGAGPGTGGSGATGGTGQACDERTAASGEVGGACRQNAQCNGDNLCLGEQVFNVGPGIIDHPEGPTHTFDVTDFPNDYCTAALPPSFPNDICATENQIACQQECGICVPRFSDADICLRGCRAEPDTNSACREGYQCDLLFEVCDTGCSSDDECRVVVVGEDLVYDIESTFVCNPQTHRCENPGTAGAEAGIACTDDRQCEPRGICLDEESFGFVDGICSKIRCDLDPCAGDGICASLGLGVPLCAAECQVGAGSDPEDPSTWLDSFQGCRTGQTCFWIGGADDPTGACVDGEYNDVTENNIGDACTEPSQCYSPFGQGTCGDSDFVCALIGEPAENCDTGFGCTVLDCAVPGMPEDVCGSDAECVLDSATGVSLCASKCASAEECALGGACADLDGDPTSLDAVCVPFCFTDEECRANEFCNQVGECEANPT